MQRRFGLLLCMSGAWALLPGCGSIPQRLDYPTAVAPSGGLGRDAILPENARRNLLYAVRGDVVNVYSYPRGTLLGALGSFSGASGLCSDAAGHVFVPSFNDQRVYEYAHGGTTPIAVLNSPYPVFACSVDSSTEDVAATSGYGVTVFPYNKKKHSYRFAQTYYDSAVYEPMYSGYDDNGDLFVDGTAYFNSGFKMSVLPRGGTTFVNLTLDKPPNAPGTVQWDGKYLAVLDRGTNQDDPAVIYRYAITSGGGTEISSAKLNGSEGYAQFWIQGKVIIGPGAGSKGGIVFWAYPKGRTPLKIIEGASPSGATVSLASRR